MYPEDHADPLRNRIFQNPLKGSLPNILTEKESQNTCLPNCITSFLLPNIVLTPSDGGA
jgi:hypothetical protein